MVGVEILYAARHVNSKPLKGRWNLVVEDLIIKQVSERKAVLGPWRPVNACQELIIVKALTNAGERRRPEGDGLAIAAQWDLNHVGRAPQIPHYAQVAVKVGALALWEERPQSSKT